MATGSNILRTLVVVGVLALPRRAALWMETQNVKPDTNGAYAVLLGAASAKGVSAEFFVSGEARWLGIRVGQHSSELIAALRLESQ